MRFRWWLVVFTLLVGCSRGESGDRAPATPSPSAPVNQSTGCDDEESMVNRVIDQGQGVEVDLDGDGTDEVVVATADPGGPPGCKAILAVISPTMGRLALSLGDEASFELGLPAVAGAAEVDGVPPKDIIVNLVSGASTGFAGLFSIREGRLERRALEGDSPYSSLFPFGGSVGHVEGSDCGAPGTVVISSATASGDGYEVVRRFFQAEDASFVLDEPATETSSVGPDALDRFAEFASVPFPSCPQ